MGARAARCGDIVHPFVKCPESRGCAKGEFLLFVGHDDRLDAGFLAIVDELIRRSPDAALFTTHFRLMDARGRVLRRFRPMPARETMVELLASRSMGRRDMASLGVVMRSSAYDTVGGLPPFEGLAYAEDALWLRLMDGSWKATAPEEAYSYRVRLEGAFLSLRWRSAIAAMERYARFVESLGHTHPDATEVWRTHAPAFLERRYRFVMLAAMLAAGNGSGRFGAREREEALASLARLSPEAAHRLRRRWWFRVGSRLPRWPLPAPALACLQAYWLYRRRWR